jgi:D-serine deaminase-like pyridoxal phosphate-dependent protein
VTSLNILQINTPALVVDRRRMLDNITTMAEAMKNHGVNLRPHFKTSKMVEVAKLQLAAGAVGMTCSTAAEVSALIEAGCLDLFWANSTATAEKARFAASANRVATVAVGVDSAELGSLLSEAAVAESTTIPVLLEVDTGLRRTGIPPEQAMDVANALGALPGISLVGVYMHEGQLASLRTSREELRDQGRKAASVLVDVANDLRAGGHNISRVSVGSTPGSDSAPFTDGVTEARPGTYVFFDANLVRLGSADMAQCAVTVISSVVSCHRPGQATIDAGIKSMSSDRSNRDDSLGVLIDPHTQVPLDLTFTRAYEEHGVLEGSIVDDLVVTQRVRIIPNHACGVVNMWSQVHVLDGDHVTETWKTVGRH